jgi:Fn3 associated
MRKNKFLLTLQQEIGFRLQSDPTLAPVPVLIRRKGVTQSDVENALGVANTVTGLRGAVIIVMMPAVDNPETDSPGPQIDALNCVRVVEKPALNEGVGGIGISAEEISVQVLCCLHFWQLDILTATVRSDKRPIVPAALKDPTAIGYDVFTRARMVLGGATVVTPKITITEGLAQLTCNTAGASIYFTTDGSYPIPAQGTTALYSVPFAASSVLIRGGAYKGEMIPSSIAHHWVPAFAGGQFFEDSAGQFFTDSTGKHFTT